MITTFFKFFITLISFFKTFVGTNLHLTSFFYILELFKDKQIIVYLTVMNIYKHNSSYFYYEGELYQTK